MKARAKMMLWVVPVALVGVALTFVVYCFFHDGLNVPVNTIAMTDLVGLRTQLKVYRGINGVYPTTEQGLAALVSRPSQPPIPADWRPLLSDVPLDPWHMRYVYRNLSTGDLMQFELRSLGRDRIESADDIYLRAE